MTDLGPELGPEREPVGASLDPRELALLSERATAKRRREFVAGRLAAHAALAALREHASEQEPELPEHMLILAERGERRGRPQVLDTELRPLSAHVSISHCAPLALAIAARTPVAIDLVRVEPQSPAFADEAFRPEELQRWADALARETDDPLVIAHAFAAKEALLKWLGLGFGLALHAVASWPTQPLDTSAEAHGELHVDTPNGARELAYARWFDATGLLALALS